MRSSSYRERVIRSQEYTVSLPLVERSPAATSFGPTASNAHHEAPLSKSHPHGLARRFVERFALITLALYHLPLFLNNYPSLGGGGMNDTGLAISWGHVFTPPGLWIARHILGATGPMPYGSQGDNGDVAEEFGRLLLAVVIGLVGAICWTLADRRRPRARWTSDWLRVLLRYSIALGLASYAISKILPMQFPPINPITLEQRVGDLAPMSLLWTFMQYSRPYSFFAGLMELVVVVLLCFRRTTTLGAALSIVVMMNVALMNYAYGVPVKLYATMTVISAMILVLYDSRRVIGLFVSNRTVAPAQLTSLPQDRIPPSIRWPLKLVLVGSVVLSSVVAMRSILRTPRVTSPIEGTWTVTSFAPALSVDSLRWHRLIVEGNTLMIRLGSDAFMSCQATTGAQSATTMTLTCSRNRKGELRWTRAGDTLRIDGVFDGNSMSIAGRLEPRSDYRLMKSKFRWMIG